MSGVSGSGVSNYVSTGASTNFDSVTAGPGLSSNGVTAGYTGTAVTFALLLENGDYLLLETGDKILLES